MALLIGALGGLVIVGLMWRLGMWADRGGLAVLLAAIAAFWPVFAVADSHHVAFHLAGFAGFLALAAVGYQRSAALLIAGLGAHGLFDAFVAFSAPPGPNFWPAFCGALDLTAALLLWSLWRKGHVA